MKLYIADQTCSQAAQIIANELGLSLEIVHYDVFGRSTSNGDNFADVNPLFYVPALVLDNDAQDVLSETIVLTSYLADQQPASQLTPAAGTLARVKFDQLLTFLATEIAQKHIPLMRKLLTEEGTAWTRNKLVAAYKVLDDRLSSGQPWINGDTFTVADAYVFATMWQSRSGAEIGHLEHLAEWKTRMDARPSVMKALAEEAEIVNAHKARLAA